jgi:PleD family two-component response regulator
MSTSKYPDAAERTKTLEHQGNAKSKRILVVEDNQLGLMLLSQLLRVHGYQILQTPEGSEAIDLARDEQPDLILMDIGLPDICGLDVTRLLKQDDHTKAILDHCRNSFCNARRRKESPGERMRWLYHQTDNY